MINNCERHVDLKHTIDNLLKINPDVIEIIGYDPFYDTPEEYNPQYTQDYIKKNNFNTKNSISKNKTENKICYK